MSETNTASTPLAPEHDLNSVVRRFSSWKNRHEPADRSLGLRELSYEEAAKSSRFSQNALRRDLRTTAATSPAERAPEKSSDAPHQAADECREMPPIEERVASSTPSHPAIARPRRRADTNRLPAAEVRALLRSAVASLAQTKPALARQKHSGIDAEPTFAAALMRASCSERMVADAGSALNLEAESSDSQTVPLTLPAEDWALIRRRASEAHLELPAYVRQCALEVEKLRALVDHALGTLQNQGKSTPPAVELASIPTPPSQLPSPPEQSSRSFGRALVAPEPESMLTRLGSLFARRGSRVSVTA